MLRVEDIHFAYRGRKVLDGLDVRVDDGEIVGLAGPNGAGKTTLLRLVSGVLRPDAGRVVIDGADVSSVSPGGRARLVAVVPQAPQLPLGYRVIELVLMGRNPHLKLLQWESRRDLEAAGRAMRLANVEHLSDRTLETLSGGERQRTVVATALAQEAPLLLLDEPTASLDLSHQTRVLDMIVDAQQVPRGAILVAIHDLTLAAQYCDRLLLLSEGRLYAEGPPGEVLTEDSIRAVYGASVSVVAHPLAGTPVVLPVSERSRPDASARA